MSDLQDVIDRLTELTKDWVAPSDTFAADIRTCMKAARRVANPDDETLAILNGQPDLYEFSQKQVKALETLGVRMIPVKNKYIVKDVLDGVAALSITEDTTVG